MDALPYTCDAQRAGRAHGRIVRNSVQSGATILYFMIINVINIFMAQRGVDRGTLAELPGDTAVNDAAGPPARCCNRCTCALLQLLHPRTVAAVAVARAVAAVAAAHAVAAGRPLRPCIRCGRGPLQPLRPGAGAAVAARTLLRPLRPLRRARCCSRCGLPPSAVIVGCRSCSMVAAVAAVWQVG